MWVRAPRSRRLTGRRSGRVCLKSRSTEADPAEINLGSLSGKSMDRQLFQDPEDVEHTFAFTSLLGNYAAITIENIGPAEAMIVLSRPNTIGWGEGNDFTAIRLPA